LFLLREIPNRIATLRIASGDRLMRFAISSGDFECAASSSTRRSSLKDQRAFFIFRGIYDFPAFTFRLSSTRQAADGFNKVARAQDYLEQQSVFRFDADRCERDGPSSRAKISPLREKIFFEQLLYFAGFLIAEFHNGHSAASRHESSTEMEFGAQNGAISIENSGAA
jgi:hypothetical protein